MPAFRLSSTNRVGETLLAAGGLLILAAIAFLPYIHRGGFMYDDWQEQAVSKLHGFGSLFNYVIDITPRRPLGALYFSIVHTVLGTHEHFHLALAAGLRALVSLALFAVLRELDFDRVGAGAAAALALLFPFSDATWLWATGGQMDLSLLCWLGGLLIAVRGLRQERHGWAWHLCAVALYTASILLYEVTLIAVALSGAVYLTRVARRSALRLWAADVGGAALAFLLFTSRWVHLAGGADTHDVLGFGDTLHHIRVIADQGVTIAARSIVPFGAPDRWAVVAGGLLLIAAAATVAWRTTERDLSEEITRWLAAAVAGVVVTVAGWGMLSSADLYYSPGQLGIGNRINALSGIGLSLLAVALARLGGTLLFSALPRDRRWLSGTLTVVVAVGIGGSYLHTVGNDRGQWWRARREQGVVLERVRGSMTHPPASSTVIARGFPLFSSPGVPVFAASWDLDGAVKLLWHDPTLHAVPAGPGGLGCGAAGVTVADITTVPASYRRTFLVDVASGRAVRIDSARQCRQLARAG
jgi:hypothetical protein